jgi:EAL domain-containing protein (putative c-di-GMP-specific phosphodiesterase class I)
VGVAIYPEHGDTASQLLKNADAAMYLAKNDGRDTIRVFDRGLADAADRALEVEQALSIALRERQMRLYFQPILSADGSRLLGAEALIRWHHPERGVVLPDEFIRIVEQSPLIAPIGQWVLLEALRHAKSWIDMGWGDARVAINLSSQQFRDPLFAESVVAALAEVAIHGKHLEIEFTERMLMGDKANLNETLDKLRSAGVELAIDDFGTGFSSFSRLREMPIQQLKIDQSFVADLPHSHSALAVVTSLLQLGRGLSIDVVAEGVENEAQRECLELLGCDAMQGYLFATPMPGEVFAQWIGERFANSGH